MNSCKMLPTSITLSETWPAGLTNQILPLIQWKQMVLSTNQLARVHDLNNQTIQLEISNRQLERVSETKLLVVKLQENLKWNDHVKDVANASYGVLHTLRKLKHFTNFNLRKRLTCSIKTRLLWVRFFTFATIPNEAPSKNWICRSKFCLWQIY